MIDFVRGLDGLVVHPQPVLHLGAKVLDDDVGGRRQAHERGVAIFALEVEHDAALVAMQVLLVRPRDAPR